MAALLSAVLFVSGAAAVAFQTLWFRQAGLVIGNSVWASSIVLASFMAGLGLGNALSATIGDRLRRPLTAFALSECTIGALGFAIVVGSFSLPGVIAPWLRPLAEMPVALDVARLAIAFGLLLVPATAMGFTLPLLVRVLFERRPNFGVALGRLYGWNTIGAVCGAVAGDAFLIRKFGVVGAAAVAASCNVLAAFGGIVTARLVARLDAVRPVAEPQPTLVPAAALRSTPRLYALLAAAFVSGGIFLALEVVWFRFLTLFVHTDSLAFSLMLAVVLLGIGAGGIGASRWLERDPRASRFAAALACVCGVACITTYAKFEVAFAPYGTGYVARAPGVLSLAASLMLPSALATGVLFPLLGAAARQASDAPARAAGRFVLANTLGSALGPLLGGFVLLPFLGMERSFFGLASAYGAVALLTWGGGLRALTLPGAACLVLALVFFPFGLMQHTYLTIPVKRMSPDGSEKVVATREGITETILYLRTDRFGEPHSYRLVTNGLSMSGTLSSGRRYMKLFVYLPVALRPEIQHSLLISYGVGSTARALLDTPGMESVDVVDVSRDILEMSSIPHPSDDPLRDPRMRIHVEDGRFFLQVTDQRFDLITGEPPPPKTAGIVYLYSQEYFQLVHDRLTDRGVATYWLPVHSLYDSDAKAIVTGFCNVFEDCTLWRGNDLDWILMGSRSGHPAPSEEEFGAQWRDPKVGPELRALGIEVPEQLGALFLADAEGLRAYAADTAPLTDRFPLRLSPLAPTLEQVAAGHRAWANVDREAAFRRSPWIASTWPPGLWAATLPYFKHQQWINSLATSGSNPAEVSAGMAEIRDLLTTTPLETLPMWLLGGGDADEVRIVHDLVRAGRHDQALEMRLGLELLSKRRYLEAIEHFRAASPNGVPSYEAFAFALAGQGDQARDVIARVRALRGSHEPDAAERGYWRWFSHAFALPDPYAQES